MRNAMARERSFADRRAVDSVSIGRIALSNRRGRISMEGHVRGGTIAESCVPAAATHRAYAGCCPGQTPPRRTVPRFSLADLRHAPRRYLVDKKIGAEKWWAVLGLNQ
jgi:hypothetical protein